MSACTRKLNLVAKGKFRAGNSRYLREPKPDGVTFMSKLLHINLNVEDLLYNGSQRSDGKFNIQAD